MARPLRLEIAGALYHVTSRGDRQEAIYENDADRRSFLSVLDDVCGTYNWVCHAYCLMGNHYHLLVETPDANLSRGMRQLNGVYTQSFNRAHSCVGHVFQGRYKAILVDKDSYLQELCRYIVLNPVRASMVRSVKDWPWSSYRATAGQTQGPRCLNVEFVLATFAKKKSVAIKRYKAFVSDGRSQPSPWASLRNQIFLGDERFVERAHALIEAGRDLSEVPSSQRRPQPKSLDYYETSSRDRNIAIISAYRSGGYTLSEIGRYFNLHYSTVSGIVRDEKSKT